MRLSLILAGCFVIAGAAGASAADSAVKTIAFDDLHIAVPDPAAAGAWYVKHLGATPTQSPHRVSFGRTLIIFSKREGAPSTVIDHYGLSVPDIDAKMKELTSAGAKVLEPVRDAPGVFKLAFIEDPFRIKIEIVQDPELLGFHHVHLRVPDPDATLKWYQMMFGGEPGMLKGRIKGLRYNTIPDGVAGLDSAAKGAPVVWLLAAKGDKMAPTSGKVIYNLAFLVEDIKQTGDAITARNVKLTRAPAMTKVEGVETGVAFAEDPDGVEIELLQRQRK